MIIKTVKDGVETEEEIEMEYNQPEPKTQFWIHLFYSVLIIAGIAIGNIAGKNITYKGSLDYQVYQYNQLKAQKANYLSGAFAIQDKINIIESNLKQKWLNLSSDEFASE